MKLLMNLLRYVGIIIYYLPLEHISNRSSILDLKATSSSKLLPTVGAVIDMKEGIIKFQFPLKKGMEHFPRKNINLPFESVTRASYFLDKT